MNTEQLLEERGKTHGKYEEHAECTQALLSIMQKYGKWDQLTPCQKESVHMFCHKMGRIATGNPHVPDHWDDIAGYAVLVVKDLARIDEKRVAAQKMNLMQGAVQNKYPAAGVPRFKDGTPIEDSNRHAYRD